MLGLLLLFMLLLIAYIVRINYCGSKYPRGPFNLPVVGYIPFLGKYPYESLRKLTAKYGPVFTINLGPLKAVVLNDYESIREVLSREVFAGRPRVYLLEINSEGRHGIVFNDGPHWKQLRHFTINTWRRFQNSLEDVIVYEAQQMVHSLAKEMGKQIELRNRFNLAVGNALWTISTGDRFSLEDSQMNRAVENITRIISNTKVTGPALILPPNPIPPQVLGVAEVVTNLASLKAKFQVTIDDHLRTPPDERRGRADYVYSFLEEMERNEDIGSAFGTAAMANLRVLLTDLFLAGTETTALTLVWLFLILASRPEIQARVCDEINNVIGTERLPSLNDKPKMPYTEAVLLELTRFVSLLPLGAMHCTLEETNFRGFLLPRGTLIMTNLWAIHRDPAIWARPDEFHPEHFLTAQGEIFYVKEFIPFSTGIRSCIGKNLANMELFLFATSLLQRFYVSLPVGVSYPSLAAEPSIVRVPPNYELVFKIRHA